MKEENYSKHKPVYLLRSKPQYSVGLTPSKRVIPIQFLECSLSLFLELGLKAAMSSQSKAVKHRRLHHSMRNMMNKGDTVAHNSSGPDNKALKKAKPYARAFTKRGTPLDMRLLFSHNIVLLSWIQPFCEKMLSISKRALLDPNHILLHLKGSGGLQHIFSFICH